MKELVKYFLKGKKLRRLEQELYKAQANLSKCDAKVIRAQEAHIDSLKSLLKLYEWREEKNGQR